MDSAVRTMNVSESMRKTHRLENDPSAVAGYADTSLPNTGNHTRKRLGAYYTSETVADSLVRWALNGKPGYVLDPSYGGCAFLRVACSQLSALGADNAAASVYGTDIDPCTAPWRAHLIGQGVPEKNLLSIDFMSARAEMDIPRCHAVVGNPPYIRHHWLTSDQLRAYQPLREKYSLSARASAWAYFVVHALSFLEPGGRLALLLPGAALHDGYAATVRKILGHACSEITFITLHERIFDNAEEETVVLLAQLSDPLANHFTKPEYYFVEDVNALGDMLDKWPTRTPLNISAPEAIAAHLQPFVPASTADLLIRCWDSGYIVRLDTIATIRIGVVTGSNNFFIRSIDDVPNHPFVKTVPIISRSKWLARPLLTDTDIQKLTDQGCKTRLMIIGSQWKPSFGRDVSDAGLQIEAAEAAGINQRHYCAKRNPWYAISDTRVPDAFLPYMGGEIPRPILNLSSATCTNAIHRLAWLDSPDSDRAWIRVLSGWSSLWQVSSELSGRHYGGGVIKLSRVLRGRCQSSMRIRPNRLSQELYVLQKGNTRKATMQLFTNLQMVC